MSADTTLGRPLAKMLYALLTHASISDNWEARADILLKLRPPPDGYIPLIYSHLRDTPLFGGLTREETLVRLHRTRRWKERFPDPTPTEAFARLINRRAQAFIAKYPARTLTDLAEQLTAKDLLAEDRIGEVTVHEIRMILRKYGYELRDF